MQFLSLQTDCAYKVYFYVSFLELSMNFSVECGIAISTSPGQSVKLNKALGN